MDNDKQVKDLVSLTRDQFLSAPLLPDDLQGDQYVLEKEFEATRKNRNLIIPLILGAFLLGASAVAFIVSYLIDDASRNAPVSVEQFKEINLRDVLDTAKRNQNDLDSAKQALSDAIVDRGREISLVEGDAKARMELLSQSGLTDDLISARRAEISAQRQAQLRRIAGEWDPKIKNLQDRVQELQKKVDEYDQRIGVMAKAQEDLINNQQQLFKREKAEQKNYYEGKLAQLQTDYNDYRRDSAEAQKKLLEAIKNKQEQEVQRLILTYNPVFNEPEIQRLIQESPSIVGQNEMAAYEDIFNQEKLWTPQAYSELVTKVGAIKVLYGKMKSIPFTNSVPKAIGALELRSFDIFQNYDQLWTKTAQRIREKNTEIKNLSDYQDRLLYGLQTYGTTIRETGFVVDARDAGDLLVVMQKIYNVSTGDQAIVFRGDEEEIARIEFTVGPGRVSAKVLSLTHQDKPIKAFDRILLNLK